jgi:hypothetical protein
MIISKFIFFLFFFFLEIISTEVLNKEILCHNCGMHGHSLGNCPRVNFTPDKEKIIL